jgi:hypothetical protein
MGRDWVITHLMPMHPFALGVQRVERLTKPGLLPMNQRERE